MDATIIGAGPIGCYVGYLLSKKGIQNTIVEEHKEIGRPEQCTGLVSRNIEAIIEPSWYRKAVLNRVYGAVISCGKQSFDVKAKDFKAYVFDRARFYKAIAEKAWDNGSEILLNHSYTSHKQEEKGLKIRLNSGKKAKEITSSLLIGADGPGSKVAKNAGLYGKRDFFIGNQVILKAKNPFFQKDKVYVFLDKRYSDGFFAWVVPIDEERAKVGLASLTKPAEYLERFLRDKFDNFVVEKRFGGVIPIYKKMPLQNRQKNVFLVGDAALHVKATSGGGVVNGMLAAKGLCESVISGDFAYEKKIKEVRRNLWLHLMIRKKFNNMNDERTAALLKSLNEKAAKEVILEKGDMDFPRKFIFKLLLSEPRLIKYIF